MSIIGCVPNVSEGRSPDVIRHLSREMGAVRGVRLLDVTSDREQNRSVFTFIGNTASLGRAVYRLMKVALETIDITHHSGRHPRMGIVDVIPFVPLRNVSMEQCVRLARRVGREIGESFGVPVYLYEQAATAPHRISVNDIREGEFEGFAKKIELPEWKPDFGPERVHPTAGVVAVGARSPLIAISINLDTDDLPLARKICDGILRSCGGEYLKALVVGRGTSGRARIAVSVLDSKRVPIHQVVEAARRLARRRGAAVEAVELVGLVTAESLFASLEHYLQLVDLNPMQVLEFHLSRKR